MRLQYAARLNDIYRAFRNEPVEIEDLDRFYCETAAVRGKNPKIRMARLLRDNMDTNEHILFGGYKGCGKSTELNYLERLLSDEFLVINISLHEELDPVNLEYIELFIVAMEKLFKAAAEKKLKISKEYLKAIQHWMTLGEIQTINEKYNISGESDIGGGVDVDFLAKFFAKFRLTAKTSKQLKTTLKTEIEPKLSDLISHCNNLIREIRLRLPKMGKKDLVFILEDLDKLPPDRADHLFYNYVSQLTQIQANVIYTFPAALFYSNMRYIRAHFARTYELPMIKVCNKDGSPSAEGISLMKEIVAARMDIENLFVNPQILEQMIRYSGGVLRDLFFLILEAAENAMDHERESINDEDWNTAFNSLKRDYNTNIADFRDGDKLYEAETYLNILVELANNSNKQVVNTEEVMHLRSNLCILAYNGQDWTDVHPIVKELLRERELLN